MDKAASGFRVSTHLRERASELRRDFAMLHRRSVALVREIERTDPKMGVAARKLLLAGRKASEWKDE